MMAKKKKSVEKDAHVQAADDGQCRIPPVNRHIVSFRIRSTSPMIQHCWPEKAKEMMRQKHAGKKTRNRDVRDPEQEAKDAAYTTRDGEHAIPGMGLKGAILSAAHKDIGTPRSLVQKALFLHGCDSDMLIPIECEEPYMREDPVTVGTSTDLRYRPCFEEWAVDVTFEIDLDLLQVSDLINLANRAGFGVGICEWRPEKGGEYGRFEVDPTSPVTCEPVKQ